jgi:hypothetical protein
MRTAPAKRIKVDDFPAFEAARYLDTETAIFSTTLDEHTWTPAIRPPPSRPSNAR